MKKFLVLIFASLLVLGACGQKDNEAKSDDNHKRSNDLVNNADDKKTEDSKLSKKHKKDKEDKENNDDKSNSSEDTVQENRASINEETTETINNQENTTQQYSELSQQPQEQPSQEINQQSQWETNRANQLRNQPNSNYGIAWTEEQQAHVEYETKKTGRPGMADDVGVPGANQ